MQWEALEVMQWEALGVMQWEALGRQRHVRARGRRFGECAIAR